MQEQLRLCQLLAFAFAYFKVLSLLSKNQSPQAANAEGLSEDTAC